ncbi:hypothetical protein D3C81_2193120 [compost metagenome]
MLVVTVQQVAEIKAHFLKGRQHIRITAHHAHEPGRIEGDHQHDQILGLIGTMQVIGINQQNVPFTEIIPLPVDHIVTRS